MGQHKRFCKATDSEKAEPTFAELGQLPEAEKKKLLDRLLAEYKDAPDVSQLPEAKPTERPGQIVGEGLQRRKLRYSKKWLEENYPMVDLAPTETTTVTFQGVTYYLFADYTIKVPCIIADIYLESRRETREIFRPKKGDNPLGLPSVPPEMIREGWTHSTYAEQGG